MWDSLETQINTVEHIQEDFEHDIQEMKGQLARLTKLIEGRTRIMPENIHGSPSFPLQSSSYLLVHHPHPNHEPYIPVIINVPPRVHRPNWQPHTPTSTIILAFKKMPWHIDQASGSRNNLGKSRTNPNKNRWDPIPVTYTELLPRVLERQLIALSHIPPIKPPFPKWYNLNVYYDYHAEKLGHSIEDCNSLNTRCKHLSKWD